MTTTPGEPTSPANDAGTGSTPASSGGARPAAADPGGPVARPSPPGGNPTPPDTAPTSPGMPAVAAGSGGGTMTATLTANPPATAVPPQMAPRPPAQMWPGWPGPKSPPSAMALAALAGGAGFAAAALPLERPGLGWLLAAVAGAAAVTVAVGRPQARRPGFLGWTAATLALLSVSTFRDAAWLVVLCVLAAGVTATLALVDARSARAMGVALLTPIPAAIRALPWVVRGTRALRRDANGNGNGNAARLLAVAAVSLVLLLIFGSLFAAADVAFGRIVEGLLPDVDADFAVRLLFFTPLFLIALAGASFLRAAPPNLANLARPAKRHLRALDWAIPVGLLVLLFLSFVLVQLTVLFGGTQHVLGPDGPTFAEYARGGFWQLLAVTALTLLVIAGAGRWAPRSHRGERALLRTLLGALAVLTLVIVASALYRMSVYQHAYGFTRLRVFVFAVELALGIVFLMVLAAGIKLRAGWLPQAVVALGVLTLLALGGLNPDRFVADRNIDRFQSSGRIDIEYLSTLSADAVPAYDRLTASDRACALRTLRWHLDHDDAWREMNLSREQARDRLAARPAGDCETYRN
jgi:hypothetical protein